LQTWRQQLIRGVLRALVIVGALALVAGSYNAYASQRVGLIPLYVGAYATLVLIALWRRVPYSVQAGTVLSLVYGLGVLGLLEAGLSGDGRVFLLTLPFLAVIFFGWRGGIPALVVTILTLAAFAWAFSTGRIVIPVEIQANSADPTAWLSGSVVFLMLGISLLISQNYLVSRLAVALAWSRRLARELEAHRAGLEEQVAERTRALQEANYALQRRAVQLEASFEVGRAITSIFDVDQLLRRTVELIRDRFGFYHAGIFLLDEAGEWAVLREATGEAGAQMKAQGHRLALGSTSMVGWTALHRQPRIALDVGEDAVHFANPLLPYTRSEMTLPLMVGGRLLGVLDVQSTEEAAFDEDDVRALQNMANQIAVAIENARRISEEAALLEATSPIYRASRRLTMAMSAEEVVEVIADLVRETGVDGCIVALAEPYGAEEPEMFHFVSSWRRDRESPIRPGTRLPVSAFHMRPEALQNLWMETSVATADRFSKEEKVFFRRAGVQSVAHIPLRIGDRQLGFVVAYRVMPGGFADGALRLYEALSDQASVALERVWLLEITRQRAEEEAALRAIGDRIARAVDVETVLYSAAEGLREAIRAEGICIELGPGVVAEDLEPVGASGG